MKWTDKVTNGFFLKFILVMNLFLMIFLFRLATIGFRKEQEDLENFMKLQERVETQHELLEKYDKLLRRCIDNEEKSL